MKKLEDENITYKLEDDGKTILVHPEQKYRVRLSLAQEGLPKGGTLGFNDIFNNTRIVRLIGNDKYNIIKLCKENSLRQLKNECRGDCENIYCSGRKVLIY